MQRTAWWTAAAAIAALAAGNALAKEPASEQRPGAGGTNVPTVGGNPIDKKDNAAQAQGSVREGNGGRLDRADEVLSFSGEHGRYHWHASRWWYWLPSNRWIYWENGAWQKSASAKSAPTTSDQNVQFSDDRYEFYNGRWWYAMPGERWVVWGSDSWREYNGNEGPERRSKGYSGLPDERAHADNRVRLEEQGPSNGARQTPRDTERPQPQGRSD